MAETIKAYISEEEVSKKIAELGEKISKDYEGKSVHLIGILKGSVMFLAELAKHISVPVTMDFMSCSSYGSGTTSSGTIKLTKDLDTPLEGKDVIIVEDIIDTGRTLAYLNDLFKLRKANSVKIATLLDKPARRVADIQVDYTCFEVEDFFIVGYGLDYDQKYRNLPFIGILEFDK